MASRITRSVPVTINDVLDGHVKVDLECLERLYLHGYLARLSARVCCPSFDMSTAASFAVSVQNRGIPGV